MSNDKKVDDYINEYFNNKKNIIGADEIFEMIQEALGISNESLDVVEELEDVDYEDLFEEFERKLGLDKLLQERGPAPMKGKSESVTIPLPKLIPSESWGDPTSDAYEQIKPFVLRAAGAAKTIEGRFTHLTRIFAKGETKIVSPGRIISSLILLESLAAVLNSFSDSSAGFVYEGFLSALTFGRQVADKVEGSLPIEDIIAFSTDGPGGVPASLKLLRGRTEKVGKRGGMVADVSGTDIHGSFRNLVSYFDRYPAIDYIVTLKTGDNNLEVTSFQINRDNFMEVLLNNPSNEKLFVAPKKMAKIKNWNELKPYLLRSVEMTEKPQWALKQSQFRKIPSFKTIASIDLSTDNLKDLNEFWATQLDDIIINLFSNVEELSKNINSFFLTPDRKSAKSRFGPSAIGNTKEIGDSMTGALKEEEPSE